jgi:hypothetical protein
LVIVATYPSSFLLQALAIGIVYQAIALSPLRRPVPMFIVANILNEEIVTMSWKVAANGADTIDEKVLTDAKSNSNGKRRKEESTDHDEE